MALNLAAGLAGAGTPELLNAFLPAAPVAVRGLPHHAPRMVVPRNDSSVPTVNMFIDGVSPKMKYAASIVDVCAGTTTFALQCTSGPSTLISGACGANAPIIALTANPTLYRVSTAVTRGDTSATIQQTCKVVPTTEATCTGTVGGSVGKETTSSVVTTTYTGSNMYRYDVAITGGAEKTANPTACAAPKKDSGAAEGVRRVGVWGVVGAVGLGLVVAM